MLWNYLGPASLAGFAMLVFLVGLNVYLAAKVKRLQVATMRLKDKRTKQTNEILNGVKVGTIGLPHLETYYYFLIIFTEAKSKCTCGPLKDTQVVQDWSYNL